MMPWRVGAARPRFWRHSAVVTPGPTAVYQNIPSSSLAASDM